MVGDYRKKRSNLLFLTHACRQAGIPQNRV